MFPESRVSDGSRHSLCVSPLTDEDDSASLVVRHSADVPNRRSFLLGGGLSDSMPKADRACCAYCAYLASSSNDIAKQLKTTCFMRFSNAREIKGKRRESTFEYLQTSKCQDWTLKRRKCTSKKLLRSPSYNSHTFIQHLHPKVKVLHFLLQLEQIWPTLESTSAKCRANSVGGSPKAEEIYQADQETSSAELLGSSSLWLVELS